MLLTKMKERSAGTTSMKKTGWLVGLGGNLMAFLALCSVNTLYLHSIPSYQLHRSALNNQEVQDHSTPGIADNHQSKTDETASEARSRWFQEIAGQGATSCDEVLERVRSGEWDDPNDGQRFAREIVAPPHFMMSVHNHGYDWLRYDNIFKKGDYYENDVMERFKSILEEEEYQSSIRSTSNNGATPIVMDIGGNIGYYALLSASRNHSVFTFEVNPANILRVCESVQMNQPSWTHPVRPWNEMLVQIFRHGVSNEHSLPMKVDIPRNPGQATIKVLPRDFDLNTTSGQDQPSSSRLSYTTTMTLDRFASERGWFERNDIVISILKIDTEGHEGPVLQGSTALLKSGMVKNALVEYRPHNKDNMKILIDAGYVLVNDTDPGQKVLLSAEDSWSGLDLSLANRKYSDLWFRLSSHDLEGATTTG